MSARTDARTMNANYLTARNLWFRSEAGADAGAGASPRESPYQEPGRTGKTDKTTIRKKLSGASKDAMFAVFLRNHEAWDQAAPLLADCQYGDADLIYKAIMEIAAKLGAVGHRPTRLMLITELKEWQSSGNTDLTEDEQEKAEEYLDWIFDSRNDLDFENPDIVPWALVLLRLYVEESSGALLAKAMTGKLIPGDMTGFLREGMERLARLIAAADPDGPDEFGCLDVKQLLQKKATREFLIEGLLPKKQNAVIGGSFKVGKTTIAADQALRRRLHRRRGRRGDGAEPDPPVRRRQGDRSQHADGPPDVGRPVAEARQSRRLGATRAVDRPQQARGRLFGLPLSHASQQDRNRRGT
jgi:hypothetical protein